MSQKKKEDFEHLAKMHSFEFAIYTYGNGGEEGIDFLSLGKWNKGEMVFPSFGW